MKHYLRYVIIIVAVALFVAGVELVVRAYFSIKDPRYESNKYINSGVCGVYTEGIWGYGNNLGFVSSKNYQPKKDNGKYRIFVVGGSAVAGSPQNNICDYLQDFLNKGTNQYEVFNCGLSGSTSTRELYLLQRWVRLKPDMVIIYDGWNDIYFGQYSTYSYVWFDDVCGNITRTARIKLFFLWHSELFRRINAFKNSQALKQVQQATPTPQPTAVEANKENETVLDISYQGMESKYDLTSNTVSWASMIIYKNNLKSMIDLCKKNKIKCIVVTQPSLIFYKNAIRDIELPENISLDKPKYNHWARVLQASYGKMAFLSQLVCAESDIPYYPFINIFDSIETPKDYCVDDCHQNEEGMKFIARELAKIVTKEK